jgi:hypothetical protein
VIVNADAVVDPLAVVIETLYASITDIAVARVRCAPDLTVRTQAIWIKVLDLLKKVRL